MFAVYARGKAIELGSGSERRGVLQLSHDFDLCPTFLSKREVSRASIETPCDQSVEARCFEEAVMTWRIRSAAPFTTLHH